MVSSSSTERGWSTAQLAALLLITAVGGVLRLWRLEQWSLSPLEAANWAAAALGGGEAIAPGNALASHVLSFLLTTGLLPSQGEGWLRLPYAFVGIVTVPLLALLGRRFVSAGAALFAAALLALHPAHVQWSQTVSTASLASLLGVVGFAGLVLLPRARRWCGVVVLVLAFACQPIFGERAFAWFVLRPATLAAAAVGAYVWWPTAPSMRAALVGCAFVPVVLATLVGLVWPVGNGAVAVVLPPLAWLAGVAAVDLGRRVHRAVMQWQPDALPWATAIPAALLGVLTCVDALIGSWLQATVYQGDRSDVRGVATMVLRDLGSRSAQVAVDEALLAFVYYMQPTRRGGQDAATGLRLVSLRHADVVAPDFVIAGESASAPWRVDARYELLHVVAQPLAGGARTVYVLRLRAE